MGQLEINFIHLISMEQKQLVNGTDGYFFDSFGDDVKPKFDQTPYKSTIDKFALIETLLIPWEKKKCRVSVEDVFRVMDICFAIMESNKKIN